MKEGAIILNALKGKGKGMENTINWRMVIC
jgi:hypothetical protein